MTIRSKWTDEYRENMPPGVTFTRCMKKNESSAEQMWSTDLSRDMHPAYNPKGAGKTGGKLDNIARQAAAAAKQQQKGAGKKKKVVGKGTAKGAGKTGKSVKLGQAAYVANKKVKTAKSSGTKNFGSYFNQKACTKGAECTFLHKCNVLTSPTTVCGKDRPASKHVGATVTSQ